MEIIKKYEPWLTFWVSEKDNGQVDAINKGLQHATGDWANWLNSDDMLLPGALEKIGLATSTLHDTVHALIFSCRIISSDGQEIKEVWSPRAPRGVASFFSGKGYPVIPQPSTFIRRNHLLPDESSHYVMDWTLYIRMEDASPGCFREVEGEIASFREHENAKTSTAPTEFSREARRFIEIFPFRYSRDRTAAKVYLKRVKALEAVSEALCLESSEGLVKFAKIALASPSCLTQRFYWGGVKRKLLNVPKTTKGGNNNE